MIVFIIIAKPFYFQNVMYKNNNMKKVIFLSVFSLVAVLFNEVKAQNIPMTFHNGSFKSIYLIIPGVMNPNLNPKSNSGVSLDVGQKVFFFPDGKKKKKEVLFTVGWTWKNDTILEIDQIVETRIKELKAN